MSQESTELNLCACGFRGFGGQDGYQHNCRIVPLIRWKLLTALSRMPTLSVRIPQIWLQGALILENSRDLVIPVCQYRTLGAGFSTCKAGMRISKSEIVGAVNKSFKNRLEPQWRSFA